MLARTNLRILNLIYSQRRGIFKFRHCASPVYVLVDGQGRMWIIMKRMRPSQIAFGFEDFFIS